MAGTNRTALRELTHEEFDRLAPGNFADGFATHNQLWGGDAYAHGAVNPQTLLFVKGYLRQRAETLSVETGLNIDDATLVLEAATDVRLRRYEGPLAGARLLRAALGAGREPRNLMAAAFGEPFSQSAAITPGEAERLIGQYATLFRLGMLVYGQQLTMPESYLNVVVPLAISMVEGTDFRTASLWFGRALQLTDDLITELNTIVPRIQAQLPPE